MQNYQNALQNNRNCDNLIDSKEDLIFCHIRSMNSFSQIQFQFKYPFDEGLCQKHRLATRIWRGISDPTKFHQVCECCGRKVGLQTVETSCKPNSSLFSFLGPGIPLFFKFNKYSILLLLAMNFVFSIYAVYSNISSSHCHDNDDCVQTIFNTMSIVNKKNQFYLLRIQNYILLAFVVCCFVLLHAFRYRFRKAEERIDDLNVSASDYSIIMKRLPNNFSKESIKSMIEKQISISHHIQNHATLKDQLTQFNSKIESIVLSYDLTNYLAQKQKQKEQFKQSVKQKKNFQFAPKIPASPNQLGQIAIVVFKDQQTKNFFIKEPSIFQKFVNYVFSAFPPLSDFKIQDKNIAIQRAPQPQDILWQNAHITPLERTKRKIILNCASFILLMIGGGCQYGLALWQITVDDSTAKVLIGTVASISVTITNLVLQTFLIYSTRWERMGTQSQYIQVLTFKLIIQQFLNAGVFVVGANILADFSETTLQNSLSETITQIMILNAITPNLTTFLINHFQIIGKFQRYFILKTGLFVTTQLEANILYELPKPDFTQKYSYIVKTLWLTAFYAPFVPVVVPLSTIGLIINYFIEKFLFSRSYSIANKISGSLNNSCMQGLQYIPLIFSVGEFLIYIYLQTFFEQVPDDWLFPIYICLGLSFTNLILPMQQFNEKLQRCLKQSDPKKVTELQRDKNYQTYVQAKEKFEITYEMTLPFYVQKNKIKRDSLLENRFKNLTVDMLARPSIVRSDSIPNSLLPFDLGLKLQQHLQESHSNINAENQSTPSLLSQKQRDQILNQPIQVSAQLLIVRKKKSFTDQSSKFQTENSTHYKDTELGSVCQTTLRITQKGPQLGKLTTDTQINKQQIQFEEAKKLFEHLERKKHANSLIQIEEENQQDEKAQEQQESPIEFT